MCLHLWRTDYRDLNGIMKPGDLSEVKVCVKCWKRKYKSVSGYWFFYPAFLEN